MEPMTGTGSVTFEQRFLERMVYGVHAVVSRELATRLSPDELEIQAVREGEYLGLKLVKEVMTDRLLRAVEDVEAWVEVPWNCTVRIDPEPRWWHRVLPWWRPEPRWVPVSGTVKARGAVQVKVEHLATFPENTIVYPARMGAVVNVSRVTAQADPRWTEQDVRVRDYPSAAVRGESTST